jgi:excisionase family DNA binding protein
MNDSKYITMTEACKLLNSTSPTIRRWAKNGKLSYIMTPGGQMKLIREDLMKFIEMNTTYMEE